MQSKNVKGDCLVVVILLRRASQLALSAYETVSSAAVVVEIDDRQSTGTIG